MREDPQEAFLRYMKLDHDMKEQVGAHLLAGMRSTIDQLSSLSGIPRARLLHKMEIYLMGTNNDAN